jgi:hypothetical protein
MKAKILLFIVIGFTLVLSACSPAASTPFPETMAEEGFGGGAPAISGEMEEARDSSFSGSNQNQAVERLVIKNADLAIVVEDPVAKMDEVVRLAEEMGGYVVGSNLRKVTSENGQEFPRANITIRVPAERLNEALEAVKAGAGEVLSENITGQDVTQDYTDQQSRLRNLEQTEAQLQAIMDDATRTEDVLQVYNELARVREQIEIIKGQIQYYEQSAALSAIAVDIQAEEALQPLSIGGWEPGGVARDAIQALINAMKFFGYAAIWIILFVVPVVLVLVIPVYLLVYAVRRIRKRRKAAISEPTPEPPQDQIS